MHRRPPWDAANPINRQRVTAMVQWVEEEAKSERRSVTDRIGAFALT